MTDRTDLRVLVVEDHELMREALARRLHTTRGLSMCAAAATVAEAVDLVAAEQPDLALVDHSLPDGSGQDVQAAVRRLSPRTAVVLLSAHDDPALIAGYLKAGAAGYAHKTVTADELARVLLEASADRPALDSVGMAKVLEHLNAPPAAHPSVPLSRREAQVLNLVAAGHTNDDIASRLFISPQTVKTHLARIFTKLGVRDRASATAKAIRAGMLD
jgi:DNA-binding NarL/FixJ family response regulator